MGILDDLTSATCASCCWWTPEVPARLHGECHHSSPLPVYNADTGKAFGFWPTTDAEDHCGSHQFRGAQP